MSGKRKKYTPEFREQAARLVIETGRPVAHVAAEIGVVMLVYVNQSIAVRTAEGKLNNQSALIEGIVEGAALRVRPIAMTVAVIIAGLLPIMWGSGTGSEVMRRIAAPMVGGMITAPLLSMFVIPAAYLLIRRPRTRRKSAAAPSIEPAIAFDDAGRQSS